MIKLLNILKEIADDIASKTWYHGSTADVDKSDLNPLYRESEKYKGDTSKQTWNRTGSSGGGVGIYFGLNKDERCSTCPLAYTGFDNTAAPYTQGFMYEMKLKPSAKIAKSENATNLGKAEFDKFRQEGIDALIDGSELNLLNPDAIQYFKKIQQWKKVSALYPVKRGKAQVDQAITFNNDQELFDFLKKELGEYKLVKAGDRQLYQPTDDNIDKSFELTTDRKWFNV